jgi:flagellar P-ring protein precursor FlgI
MKRAAHAAWPNRDPRRRPRDGAPADRPRGPFPGAPPRRGNPPTAAYALLLVLAAAAGALAQPAAVPPAAVQPPRQVPSMVRIKDLVRVAGADDNVLKGIGLVVGLKGTGDSLKGIQRALSQTLLKMDDFQIPPDAVVTKNVALVAVSARVKAFQEPGTDFDVTVASLGDAKSLQGGELLLTHHHGPNAYDKNDPDARRTYATAHGAVYIGGNADFPTVGLVPRGGILVERIPQTSFYRALLQGHLVLLLNKPDFNVATLIAETLRKNKDILQLPVEEEQGIYPLNAGSVLVTLPKHVNPDIQVADAARDPVMKWISNIMQAQVGLVGPYEPEAKVVINEKNKTWVVTGRVLVVPTLARKGSTVVAVGRGAGERPAEGAVTLQSVLEGMEEIGATPNDIIDILKELDGAGAIIGRVEIRP